MADDRVHGYKDVYHEDQEPPYKPGVYSDPYKEHQHISVAAEPDNEPSKLDLALGNLPPKWSQMLSGDHRPLSKYPERIPRSGVIVCTCINRREGMQHFEDCPKALHNLDPAGEWYPKPKVRPNALLGLASTEELLLELISRGRVEPTHIAAGRAMTRDCQQILDDLPPEMKSYRTVE